MPVFLVILSVILASMIGVWLGYLTGSHRTKYYGTPVKGNTVRFLS